MAKNLINSVTLEVTEEGVYIDTHLSIPVELDKGIEKTLLKDNFKDKDLGVVRFSDKTSELIRSVAEAIRNDLLKEYEICKTQQNKNGEKSERNKER